MVEGFVDAVRRHPVLTMAVSAVIAGLVFFAVFPADSSVTSDDGAYELTVEALRQDGSWSVDYVLDDADPAGIGAPFARAKPTDEGYFLSTKRPLWIVLLFAADAVDGIIGQRLLLCCRRPLRSL